MSSCEPMVCITTLDACTPPNPSDNAEWTEDSPEFGLLGEPTALRIFRESDTVQAAKKLPDAGVEPKQIRPDGRRRAERSIFLIVPTNNSIHRHH